VRRFPDLPLPRVEGYSVAQDSGREPLDMAAGNARVIASHGERGQVHAVEWLLTHAEGATLAAFHAAVGRARFAIGLWVPGGLRLRVVFARFVSDLTMTPGATGRVRIAAALAVADFPVQLALSALRTPDGDPLTAPSGAPLLAEDLA
jgi:hypothetical protein